VNKYGIFVAVVFQRSEKRDSDAKNNKRAFFPEESASEKALALVASDVWHLLFADQKSLLPQQIKGMALAGALFGHGLRHRGSSRSNSFRRENVTNKEKIVDRD
jgi:hypothetical protein